MIALWLAGCAYTLGRAEVRHAPESAPLPLVRTATDPRWYLPILVEGQGLWVFFVDTGYSYTTCDDGLIEALGLETRGRTVVRGELGRIRATKAILPTMTLAGHAFDGLVCQVRDLDRTSSIRDTDEVRIAGVLGMDVMRPFVVRMDPQRGELALHAPDAHPDVGPGTPGAVKLRREHRLGIRAVAPVTVNGRTVWPVLDTGASGTHLDGDRLGLEPTRVREDVVVRGSGGSGTALRTIAYYEVGDLTLAGMNPGTVVFTGRDGFGAGLLGLNVLSRFVATYDFPSGRARFEPVTPRRLPTFTEWRSAERPPEATRIAAPAADGRRPRR